MWRPPKRRARTRYPRGIELATHAPSTTLRCSHGARCRRADLGWLRFVSVGAIPSSGALQRNVRAKHGVGEDRATRGARAKHRRHDLAHTICAGYTRHAVDRSRKLGFR